MDPGRAQSTWPAAALTMHASQEALRTSQGVLEVPIACRVFDNTPVKENPVQAQPVVVLSGSTLNW